MKNYIILLFCFMAACKLLPKAEYYIMPTEIVISTLKCLALSKNIKATSGGDDETLGLKKIELNKKIPSKIIFEGIHALDKYEYECLIR